MSRAAEIFSKFHRGSSGFVFVVGSDGYWDPPLTHPGKYD